VPGVDDGFEVVPTPPFPPHSLRPPIKAIVNANSKKDKQFFRYLGVQGSSRISATIASPVALNVPLFRVAGRTEATLAAVEFTVTVAVPAVFVELSVTASFATHVGLSVAPGGLELIAHVRETVPAYPFVELILIVDVPSVPGLTVTEVADMENEAFLTVTAAVPNALV
jgi:hypothetical protein